SLSLSPASPAPEATGSYRRCQNRFYRQTFPKVGSASSRFREQYRFVVERDRQPSATGGIAAATRAWLSAPSSTATLFTLNIASIVCSPESRASLRTSRSRNTPRGWIDGTKFRSGDTE